MPPFLSFLFLSFFSFSLFSPSVSPRLTFTTAVNLSFFASGPSFTGWRRLSDARGSAARENIGTEPPLCLILRRLPGRFRRKKKKKKRKNWAKSHSVRNLHTHIYVHTFTLRRFIVEHLSCVRDPPGSSPVDRGRKLFVTSVLIETFTKGRS